MNAAEKARLAKQAQKESRKKRQSQARKTFVKIITFPFVIIFTPFKLLFSFIGDHLKGFFITLGILVGIAAIGIGIYFAIPPIQDFRETRAAQKQAEYDRTHYEEDGVTYVLKSNGYTADSMAEGIADLVIHSEVNGLPVVEINGGIAKKSLNLKTVTIEVENSLELPKRTFKGCPVLSCVTVTGGGTLTLGRDVFADCLMLTTLTVRDATVRGVQYMNSSPRLSIRLEDGEFIGLFDVVNRVEITGHSTFGAEIVGSGCIAKECVLLNDIGSEKKLGALGFGFQEKPHTIAPIYYIGKDVTSIPDNLFGTEKDTDKITVCYGGTEAEWETLISTANRETNQRFFDLGSTVTVNCNVTYEDFNNRK